MKPVIVNRSPVTVAVAIEAQQCIERLREAAVCGEQAREAARIKRWHAASGLFSTAMALCRQAEQAAADEQVRREALLLRQQLSQEARVHDELARSMNRPFRRAPASSSQDGASLI